MSVGRDASPLCNTLADVQYNAPDHSAAARCALE